MHLAAGLGPQQACHLAGIPAKHFSRSIKDADLQRKAEVGKRKGLLVEQAGLRLGQQRSEALPLRKRGGYTQGEGLQTTTQLQLMSMTAAACSGHHLNPTGSATAGMQRLVFTQGRSCWLQVTSGCRQLVDRLYVKTVCGDTSVILICVYVMFTHLKGRPHAFRVVHSRSLRLILV